MELLAGSGLNLATILVVMAAAFIFIVFISQLLAIWHEIRRSKAISDALADIPCPTKDSHWLLGSMKEHPGPGEKGLMLTIKWMKDFPKYYALDYSSVSRYVVLNHPESVKDVLKSSEPKILSGFGWGYKFLLPWLGDGLLVSSGRKWTRNRRLLTPGFHFDILKPYVQVYNRCLDSFMDNLLEKSRKRQSVPIFKDTTYCTLNIVLKCAFSFSGDVAQEGGSSRGYADNVAALSGAVVQRIYNPLYYIDSIYFYLTSTGRKFQRNCRKSHDFTLNVIRKRKQVLKEVGVENLTKGKRFVDFLDILLLARDEGGNELTEEEIMEEVETFMFEGHDTTKSAIAFAFYNLARNPDIQARVREEVTQLLEERDEPELVWDDLGKLPYTTQCIKESMRLHPPVVLVGRQLTQEMKLDGHLLPVGTPIEINIWNVHHNPHVWGEDHMDYRPERFDENRISKMDPFAYIPFSAGSRNCIGQHFAMNEIKSVVARVVHKFNIEEDLSHKVELVQDLILRTKNDIKLFFTPVDTA